MAAAAVVAAAGQRSEPEAEVLPEAAPVPAMSMAEGSTEAAVVAAAAEAAVDAMARVGVEAEQVWRVDAAARERRSRKDQRAATPRDLVVSATAVAASKEEEGAEAARRKWTGGRGRDGGEAVGGADGGAGDADGDDAMGAGSEGDEAAPSSDLKIRAWVKQGVSRQVV